MSAYDSEDEYDKNSDNSGEEGKFKDEHIDYEELQFDDNGEINKQGGQPKVHKGSDGDDCDRENDEDMTKVPNFTYIGKVPTK